MYREIRAVQSIVEALQSHIGDALRATSTRDMIEHAGRAHVSAVAAKEELDRLLGSGYQESETSFGDPHVDPRYVDAANRALSVVITEAEKIALGVDVDSMRARLIDFKTRADYADAYLRVAVGMEGDG
jgi:hypothetical protein